MMNMKKLFAKAETFLNSDKRKRKEKKKCLKHVLKKLRKQEEKLNARLQNESDEQVIDKLNRKIALVHAQRKKGLALMKELMEKKKSG
ncbi:MAG TPA: hypothetical protein DDW45_04345 [Gammaproteobacteria bacterium]|nr:hypothetical protein [Gammaproteobacteria bacterium]